MAKRDHHSQLTTHQGRWRELGILLIQTRDSLLHLTFTNNRQTIDHIALTADWIEGHGKGLPPWDGTARRLQ